jgi:hypothetical protein
MGVATDGRVAFTGKVPENSHSLKAESHEETGIEVIHSRSSLLCRRVFGSAKKTVATVRRMHS